MRRESPGNQKSAKAAHAGSWEALLVRQVQSVCWGIGASFPASLTPRVSVVQARDEVNDTLPNCNRRKHVLDISVRREGVGLRMHWEVREVGSPARGCTALSAGEGCHRRHAGTPAPCSPPRNSLCSPSSTPGAGLLLQVMPLRSRCQLLQQLLAGRLSCALVRHRCFVLRHSARLVYSCIHSSALRASLCASLLCHLLCPLLNVSHSGPQRRGSAWRRVSPSRVEHSCLGIAVVPTISEPTGPMTDSCLCQMLTLTEILLMCEPTFSSLPSRWSCWVDP